MSNETAVAGELKIGADEVKMLFEYYEALGYDRLPVDLPETSCSDGSCLRKEEMLRELSDRLEGCTRCRLSEERRNVVFGEGAPDAELLFVGEGPGRDEDREGRPFVGRAGQLLTNLILKMGFSREVEKNRNVYIANTVKCRPPGNRNPMEDELDICLSFLSEQIDIIKPEVIMTLGAVATKALLGDIGSISKLRGKIFHYKGIPLIPTFHPAYLLRNPKDKWLTWSDALLAQEQLKK